jgi:hypothetical protein
MLEFQKYVYTWNRLNLIKYDVSFPDGSLTNQSLQLVFVTLKNLTMHLGNLFSMKECLSLATKH